MFEDCVSIWASLDGLINHFLIRMPQWIIHPSSHLLKHWGDSLKFIWSQFLCFRYLSQRQKTKCLIPLHCCSVDILHCSKRWPIANKWQYCTKCSSLQRENNPPNIWCITHSITGSLPLCFCLIVSLQVETCSTQNLYTFDAVFSDFSHCLTHFRVTNLWTGCSCSSLQGGLRTLYIDLHHLTLRNDPMTTW